MSDLTHRRYGDTIACYWSSPRAYEHSMMLIWSRRMFMAWNSSKHSAQSSLENEGVAMAALVTRSSRWHASLVNTTVSSSSHFLLTVYLPGADDFFNGTRRWVKPDEPMAPSYATAAVVADAKRDMKLYLIPFRFI